MAEVELLTRSQLAKLVGVTAKAIDRARELGRIGWHPGTHLFEKQAALRAWRDFAGSKKDDDEEDYRERAEKAKALLLELELETKRGLLVPAAEVRRVWYDVLRSVRDRVLGVPVLLCDRLSGETSPAEIRRLMEEELRSALHTTSDGLQNADGSDE